MVAAKYMGKKLDDIVFVGTKTLAWACRLENYGSSSNIGGVKDLNESSVRPISKADEVSKLLNHLLGIPAIDKDGNTVNPDDLYPKFPPLPNFLVITVMNINALVHPALSYGHFCDFDDKTPYKKKVYLYEDCSLRC